MEPSLQIAEIGHRVANSFQMAAAMLAREGKRSPAAAEPLARAGAQLTAFALIHRMLEPSQGGPVTVCAGTYLAALCAHLERACLAPRVIALKAELRACEVTPQQAQCLGLIATELVLNAAKHAFSGLDRGMVEVGLSRFDGGKHLLWVADDGVGCDRPAMTQSTLGRTLVDRLARAQGGECRRQSSADGTRVSVFFPAAAELTQ